MDTNKKRNPNDSSRNPGGQNQPGMGQDQDNTEDERTWPDTL